MTMRAPLDGSLEKVLDYSPNKDVFIMTHQVLDGEDGEPRKVQRSLELCE